MIRLKRPVIGQECLCPDGVGRVHHVEFWGEEVHRVYVDTYINNVRSGWDRRNVKLLKMPEIDDFEEVIE